MWNSNYIIKFELGIGIVKAANSPDTRNLFKKKFGKEPEDDIKLIMEGTGHIRKYLASIGITLPFVHFSDNSTLGPNEFICYWGIEKGHYSITYLEDLFDFIKNKASEYAEEEKGSFQYALTAIGKDQNQQAYDSYKRLYYTARQKDDFFNSARALTEVSGIIAHNGNLNFAYQLASEAVRYVESDSIVDKTLKCQAYLNLASIMKSYNAGLAIEYFMKCARVAYISGNSQFMFFAYLGLAETYTLLGNIRDAITNYEHSLDLINNTEATFIIQRKMISLYKYLIDQSNRKTTTEDWRRRISDVLISITMEVCKNLCLSAIFKVFNIQGSGAIISFGTKYLVENNMFNAPTVIGENNSFN